MKAIKFLPIYLFVAIFSLFVLNRFLLLSAQSSSDISVEITPLDDTFIWKQNATSNYGGEGKLRSKIDSGNSSTNRISYLKFDLTNLSNFTSAFLELSVESFSGNSTIEVYSSDFDWNESNLVWGPTTDPMQVEHTDPGTLLMGSQFIDSVATYQIDITSALQVETANSNNIVTLVLIETASELINFHSSESSSVDLRPRLNITIPQNNIGVGDNLGNHTASENLKIGDNWISGDGDDEGLQVDSDGNTEFSGDVILQGGAKMTSDTNGNICIGTGC